MSHMSPRPLPPDAVQPRTRDEWRAWLAGHHDTSTGVWLVSAKKATGQPRVEYDEAVEEALCFGWIDSVARTLDETRSMLRFSPRKPRSGWSRSNKIRIERLAAAGLMTPAGQARIDAAIADGSWTQLDAVENLEVPEDLAHACAAYPNARANFDAFPRSARRGILEWIAQAKRPETRARRVAETARLAESNYRANQWTRPKS
jgi:uncharacterized protein YdeI (YjbR/CyaY-like superfamily)